LAFAFAFVIPEPGSPGQSASRLAITETPRKKRKGALRSAAKLPEAPFLGFGYDEFHDDSKQYRV
jgi:hypothetical protein